MDGIPCSVTHFHILKGNHLITMGVNVQISVDLEFFCWPHTKICRPHLLTKGPNFFPRKKLATFLRATVLCGHLTDRVLSKYAIPSTLFLFARHVTRIVFAQIFARMSCGQQNWLRLLVPSPMIPQAYFFMENSTQGPSPQGKSPSQRDFQWKQRIQDANANIIQSKGVGINTFKGIGVYTNAICHRDTMLVQKNNIKVHPLLPPKTGTQWNVLALPKIHGRMYPQTHPGR